MSSPNFAELLSDQEEHAGWIQRFWTNVSKLGKEKMTREALEQRQKLLDRYWDTFYQGHRLLKRFKETPTSNYVQQGVYQTVEEAYMQAGAMIAQCISERPSAHPSAGQQTSQGDLAHHQLPKIPLPTFSGDPLHWESFRDLFKSLVHDVPQVSSVKKLLYLKSSLTGEAAEVIQNTPITDAAYRGAWEDLEYRYGNTRLLSFAHHRALLCCPAAEHQSPSELKRLLDTFRQTIRAYSALRKPIASWDEWFVYILSQKLDATTRLAWETSLENSREIPSFQQLSHFLENRMQALDSVQSSDPTLRPASPKGTSHRTPPNRGTVRTLAATSRPPTQRKCPSCANNHTLGYCSNFKSLPPRQQRELVHQLRACLNCLTVGHEVGTCPSKNSCLACRQRHHTLLHEAMGDCSSGKASDHSTPVTPASTRTDETEGPRMASSFTMSTAPRHAVLLATAKVQLEAPNGATIDARALLDTGSDTSLVSSWVIQAMRCPRRAVRVAISGVQQQESGLATSEVQLHVRSKYDSNFRLPVRALVLKKLTAFLPAQQVQYNHWPHLDHINLADPGYGVPARVDLILGADVCGALFQDASRVGPPGTPTARKTPFGWVLMGPASSDFGSGLQTARSFHCSSEDDTHRLLQRFWELEELQGQPPISHEEKQCEQQFRDTHSRDSTGRYSVSLPFKLDPGSTLRPSRSSALKMLLTCERRLNSDESLASKYGHFMSEYRDLYHMEAVPASALRRDAYYLPHHAVVKRHDPAAKLRVVFNASFRTASGYSLNDCLLPGPKLQSDLWMILTRWRLFRVVFTSDIVKMFRQIRVHPGDADWQRILWRLHPDDPAGDFRLTTVTYGTACAPFLALRVLAQLADDEQENFPLGASTIRRHTYVDDILTGADDEKSAVKLQQQVISIFRSGGFELSKWASNSSEFQDQGAADPRLFQDFEGVSTLGVLWSPRTDTFSLRVLPPMEEPTVYSKRQILSEVARLFDPLGWVSPVLIYAKILMQDLWILGAGWDDHLPQKIQTSWCAFRRSLSNLESLKIPRWTQFSSGQQGIELHGFCDASQRAYAAAVYLRVRQGGLVTTTLLVAKTKVAPVKTVSIPRLELCGAVLLAKLLTKVKEGLNISEMVTAWTDSSVTLHWIRGHASGWKPFVAHRVATVQSNVPPQHWRHVVSSSNPADLATRGISPAELLTLELWWKGPSWLADHPHQWPTSPLEESGVAEQERGSAQVFLSKETDTEILLTRFSSLSRLLSVTAYCFRFGNLSRKRACATGFLRATERASALRAVLRISQRCSFRKDIDELRRGAELSRTSTLTSLRPFLDDEGLLRVGGRLSNAAMPFNDRHPYIVAKTSPLAILLIRDAHLRTLHGGPQLTRSLLSRKIWIVHGRSLIRATIRECTVCARYNRTPHTQVMAPLPPERIRPQRAFLNTGVDYAGPILLRTSPGRGHKAYKGYISLFVCLVTRAIHLEVVSDLSSAAFLAAFRRFIGRRGRCIAMISDNGTVFHGADRELRAMFSSASTFYKEAASSLAADGTDWSFIPPHAPHFGGLWEAGVKSVKHHLRRVIGDTTLTFEEMSTLLCQIEACVNSRPLHPLSDDPSDLAALTPGHFLIGEPTCNIPEPEPDDSKVSLTSRWRLLTQMRSHFWNRWHREYLLHLQQLPKWRRRTDNLKVGSLVLLRDELQPPAKWPMGRIEALHPGADGQVRVITLRTARGTFTRPIVKVCPLPLPSDDADQVVTSL